MEETRWVRVLAFACGAAVASFGGIGLLLAVAGDYRPALVFPLGFVGWIALLFVARRVVFAPGRTDTSSHVAAAAAVVLATSVGIWNALNVSQHVLLDRDPGVYNSTARWIARYGNLEIPKGIGSFANLPFRVDGPGVNSVPGRASLMFQGAHFLPTLLAEFRAIGGDALMFRGAPILGAIALLAFFVVASRVLRNPWAALGAMTCLAFVMPEVAFSRDSYSELPTHVLFFTAIWLLCDESNTRRVGVMVAAGLSLGLLQATRIDALAAISGLPILVGIAWWRTARPERRAFIRATIAGAVAVGCGLILGLQDLRVRSRHYFTDLHDEVMQLVALAIVAVLAGVFLIIIEPWAHKRFSERARSLRRPLAITAMSLTVGVAAFAWFVRPAIDPLRKTTNATLTSALQRAIPDSAYYAHSVVWLRWYLGPVVVALAVAGAAMAAWSIFMRFRWSVFAAVAMLAPETVLYLWRPSATPDQVWVTRRLMVAAFPATILLAFGALVAITPRLVRWHRVIGTAVVAVLAGVAVLYPIGTVIGVRTMSEQHGYLSVLQDVCDTIGRDGVLVMLEEKPSNAVVTVPHAARTFCGVPAAFVLGGPQPKVLQQAAQDWASRGRKMWIASEHPETLKAWFPGVTTTMTTDVVNTHALARPFRHRPQAYETQHLALALAPVPLP